MQTSTAHEASSQRRKDRLSPLSLLIATIREQGGGEEKESRHRAAFMRLINEEGYEDYREAAVSEWLDIKYSTAVRAAQPPSPEDLKRRQHASAEKRAAMRAAIDEVKAKIKGKMLQMIMPNGKRLGACAGTELIRYGGWITLIGESVGERKVRDVLNEEQILKLIASK
jgi:hypothetical protein